MRTRFFFVFLAIVLFVSCAATPSVKTVFDDSIPLEHTAWISTTFQGSIVGFNGIPVEWKKGDISHMIQIPAGDALLEWNIQSGNLYIQRSAQGVQFQYNFQPQKQYIFLLRIHGDIDGFDVWHYDIGENMDFNPKRSDEQHYAGFTPFLQDIIWN